jgi:hypothetical protein
MIMHAAGNNLNSSFLDYFAFKRSVGEIGISMIRYMLDRFGITNFEPDDTGSPQFRNPVSVYPWMMV